MSSKLHYILVLGAMLLVGCGYDSHTPPSDLFDTTVPNATIEALRYYAEEGVEVAEEIVVEGTVVADDKSGNFYRAIVVEDSSGAVEVRLGLYDLGAHYPIGCRVTIEARGLAVAYYDGVLTLGREIYDWSGGRMEPIEPRDEISKRIEVTAKGTPPQPTTLPIGALTTEMCGRLTRVEGVHYVGQESSWGITDYGTESDREFTDTSGAKILVRTSRYADFAEHNIPTEEVAITGILYTKRYKGEDLFILKMRDLGDVER